MNTCNTVQSVHFRISASLGARLTMLINFSWFFIDHRGQMHKKNISNIEQVNMT